MKERIMRSNLRLSEIESPAQNISTHASLEPRVPRIAIVGTGFVGSTTAYALMMSGIAAEIVLIGRDSRRAEGHVNDLRDTEVFSHATRIFVGDFSDCCSADVTIITAGVSQSGQRSRMEGLRETGAILHGLVNDVCLHNPRGILLIASNPVDVLTYAAWKWSGLPADRVIGSGTRSRFFFHDMITIGQPPSPLLYLLDAVIGALHIRSWFENDALNFLERLLDTNASRVQGDVEQRVVESRLRLESDVRKLLREVSVSAEQARPPHLRSVWQIADRCSTPI
jgi:hypothetical protein